MRITFFFDAKTVKSDYQTSSKNDIYIKNEKYLLI